ncbi:MAG: ABC transporter substrate-binding protein [Clostridia bacterium]|nr:ABC transporter substrate-binding protein [Clostridia bacterium]NCC44673.1 ABC transporter substrate-binding protein [Clostridia bacterium]
MNRWKKIVGVILSGLLVVSLAACQGSGNGAGVASENVSASGDGSVNGDDGEEGTIVKIGYLPITHALPVFEEKELLDSGSDGITIELQKFSSWSDLTDALNTGRIDGASVLIEMAMSAVSQGIDLKVAALGHKDGNVIVVSDEINSTEDLKGKTFAIPHTQSSHNILLNDMLAEAGMTAGDISVVQLSPLEMPSSLASGAIAGYCVAEPFGAQAVNQGFGHVLYNSEELWEDSLCCGLVLTGAFIEKNKEVTDTLIERYKEAGKALEEEEAKRIAGQYLGQDEKVLETSLQWIRFDDLEITREAYQTLTDKVKEYGINANPPTYEDFVYQDE